MLQKKVSLVIGVLATLAMLASFATLTMASETIGDRPLKDHDPAQYEEMVNWYMEAGWTEQEARAAADRITAVDVVIPSSATPTPTPTPKPTPTPTPPASEMRLIDYDPNLYFDMVDMYVDAGFSEEEARAIVNKIMVQP